MVRAVELSDVQILFRSSERSESAAITSEELVANEEGKADQDEEPDGGYGV